MIIERISYARPEMNGLNLNVSQDNDTVTVEAGLFKIAGQDYELDQVWTFQATSRPNMTVVMGYLVQDKTTEVVSMVIDEFVQDGVDVRWVGDPNLNVLEELFWIKVPENVTNLDDIEVQVLRQIPPPPVHPE